MKRITNYMVLNEYGGDISKKVNDLIANGWQPIGGVSVVLTEGPVFGNTKSMTPTFHQAMVIYES